MGGNEADNTSRAPDEPPQMTDQFYRLACRAAGVAMIATDPQLRVVAWNSAAERIFGSSAEQMMGTSVLSAVPEDRRSVASQVFNRVLGERQVREFEVTMPDRDGGSMTLAITIWPVTDDDGTCLGTCACTRDISRVVKLQEGLRATQKMSALASLAGRAAHHFNNLLGGIVTTVDYALRTKDSAGARRALESAAAALARATSLAQALLAFAEGDRRELARRDLRETVIDFARGVEATLKRHKIDLALDVAQIGPLELPAQSVETVLGQLAQNAIEAMPDGGRLRIELREHDDEIGLRFVDTGSAMSTDQLEHAFEPFFTTKDEEPGGHAAHPGLGLAVVHGIVTDLGGTITASSRAGEGTTIEIRIPTAGRPDATPPDSDNAG